MSNLLTRAELSKLEAMTNPTKSSEETEKGDFDGDTISTFFIAAQNGDFDGDTIGSLEKK